MGEERLVELAKRAFAADVGQPVAEVEAVLADPRLSLAAAGVAALLERRCVPIVRAVLDGQGAAPAERSATPALGLSEREVEVLGLLAEGLTDREIAERLCIGLRTAETHVARACRKLGARTRAGAAVKAVRLGLA